MVIMMIIANNLLFSIYASCFLYINPVDFGEGVKVCGEFDWLEMSIEIKGEDNFNGIYDGHKWSDK